MSPSIKAKLKAEGVKLPTARNHGPVWAGPAGEGPNGGVSYSLLSRYLVCKERFRLLTMLGLKPNEKFSAPLEFGSMWHVVEEGYGKNGCKDLDKVLEGPFQDYCKQLWKKYPMQREEIGHWAEVTHDMFPRYFKRWQDFPDVKERKVLMPETAFNVVYTLPSGRKVRLRGKWDSVDSIGSGKEAGVYLQENKTKSRLDPVQITRQLSFDLQTMLYLVALREHAKSDKHPVEFKPTDIKGVRYNVIKRGSHKTVESMMKKLDEDTEAGRVREWFDRYKVEVSDCDVEEFKTTCMHPVLENLCDDYEWWTKCMNNQTVEGWAVNRVFDYEMRKKLYCHHQSRHYRHPFGVYNVLDEGGAADLDNYLATGSEVGLHRIQVLFPELENATHG